jgi:hypothetical protein
MKRAAARLRQTAQLVFEPLRLKVETTGRPSASTESACKLFAARPTVCVDSSREASRALPPAELCKVLLDQLNAFDV